VTKRHDEAVSRAAMIVAWYGARDMWRGGWDGALARVLSCKLSRRCGAKPCQCWLSVAQWTAMAPRAVGPTTIGAEAIAESG